jgi:pheromone a factor receptor
MASNSDVTYPLYPIFAFLGFILALVPLPWHMQAWNAGTCFYMFWTALACLNQFVNTVVWANDAIIRAPIWCDISIRIISSASIGIPAASLCIVRRLYTIASVQSASVSRAQKRRQIMIDTCICFVFPLFMTALQFIVQGHRFDILEGVGCTPAIYNTLLTYFIYSIWPAIIGLVSAVYCIMALLAFRRRQVEFNQFLRSSSSLTVGRYFRLMALAMVETMCTTPLTIATVILSLKTHPLEPWISVSDTHIDFWRIEQYPALLWRQNHVAVVSAEVNRWVVVLCALVFFAFFGFAEEARRNYKLAFLSILKFTHLNRVLAKCQPSIRKSGPKPLSLASRYDSKQVLPLYMPKGTPIASQDRLSSSSGFTDVLVIQREKSAFSNPPSPTSSSLPSYYEMMVTPTSSTFCPTSSSVTSPSSVYADRHRSINSVSESRHSSGPRAL